jgi:hypothetical protein
LNTLTRRAILRPKEATIRFVHVEMYYVGFRKNKYHLIKSMFVIEKREEGKRVKPPKAVATKLVAGDTFLFRPTSGERLCRVP